MCNYCTDYIGRGVDVSILDDEVVEETTLWRGLPSKSAKVKGLDGKKHRVVVCHMEGHGVIVVGTSLVGMAHKAMVKVGYDKADFARWGYRPMCVDQVWHDRHARGGTSAVAFYF